MSPRTKPSESVTSKADAAAPSKQRIVFFDGVCGLCSRTIDFLMRRDHRSLLRFAPLQGSTAQSVVPDDVREELSTFVYAREGQLYYRSSAMLRILRDLGGVLGFLATICTVIPAPVRDVLYRAVARIRYRVFGKHESCRLPTPEERTRFLD